MRQQIEELRRALEDAREIDHETKGELMSLGLLIAEKGGARYTYGLPGSDPNVEQLPDGRLRLSLIQPIVSGTESIDTLVMRVPTLGDAKKIKVSEGSGNDEVMVGLATKVQLTCRVEATGRSLTASEIDGLIEEDALTLNGAFAFLQGRFRRTGKTFKTS